MREETKVIDLSNLSCPMSKLPPKKRRYSPQVASLSCDDISSSPTHSSVSKSPKSWNEFDYPLLTKTLRTTSASEIEKAKTTRGSVSSSDESSNGSPQMSMRVSPKTSPPLPSGINNNNNNVFPVQQQQNSMLYNLLTRPKETVGAGSPSVTQMNDLALGSPKSAKCDSPMQGIESPKIAPNASLSLCPVCSPYSGVSDTNVGDACDSCWNFFKSVTGQKLGLLQCVCNAAQGLPKGNCLKCKYHKCLRAGLLTKEMLKGSTNSDVTSTCTPVSSPQVTTTSASFLSQQQQELLRNSRSAAMSSDPSPLNLNVETKVNIENPCFGRLENFAHVKVPPPPLVRPDELESHMSRFENNQLQVLLTQSAGSDKQLGSAGTHVNGICREDQIPDVSPFRDELNGWNCSTMVDSSNNRVPTMLAPRKRSPPTSSCDFLSNVNGPLNLTVGGAVLPVPGGVSVSSLAAKATAAPAAALLNQVVSPTQVVTVNHPMSGTSQAAAVSAAAAHLIQQHNSSNKFQTSTLQQQQQAARKFTNPLSVSSTFREPPPPLVPAMSITNNHNVVVHSQDNNSNSIQKLQQPAANPVDILGRPAIDAGYFKLVALVDRQSPMDSKVHQLLSSLLLTPQGIDQAMASLVGVLLDWASGLKSIIPQSLFISIFTQQWCSLVLLTQIYHHKRHSHQDIQLKVEFVQRNINSDSEIVRKFSQSLQHLVYVQTKLHEMSLSREFYAALKVLLLLNKQKDDDPQIMDVCQKLLEHFSGDKMIPVMKVITELEHSAATILNLHAKEPAIFLHLFLLPATSFRQLVSISRQIT